jgi:hypothetical protein
MGLISLLDNIIDKLPIQGRKERWKNQIDQLEAEKLRLLAGECNDKTARRLADVERRINELNRLCRNAL